MPVMVQVLLHPEVVFRQPEEGTVSCEGAVSAGGGGGAAGSAGGGALSQAASSSESRDARIARWMLLVVMRNILN